MGSYTNGISCEINPLRFIIPLLIFVEKKNKTKQNKKQNKTKQKNKTKKQNKTKNKKNKKNLHCMPAS